METPQELTGQAGCDSTESAPRGTFPILPVYMLVSTEKCRFTMSAEPINYEAVIADLEAKKAQLESTISMLRALGGLGTIDTPTPTGGGGGSTGGRFAADAFMGKSIPEAAVTILQSTSPRRKMSTQDLMDTMEKGGLPSSKYNTVYSILRRRESQVGDLINMQGEWGLSAWYPNHAKKAPPKKEAASADSEPGAEVTVNEVAEEEAALEKQAASA